MSRPAAHSPHTTSSGSLPPDEQADINRPRVQRRRGTCVLVSHAVALSSRSERRQGAAVTSGWMSLPYEAWSATCDTVHAHTQVLGKLAAMLAPPEPQLQHAASAPQRAWLGDPATAGARRLRRTRRRGRPAPPRGRGRAQRRSNPPHPADPRSPRRRRDTRAVGRRRRSRRAGADRHDTTRDSVDRAARRGLRAPHLRSRGGVRLLHGGDSGGACARRVARPDRGRSTPVNAWWGTFDLAVSLFSGRPVDPPSNDFIMRNSANAEQVEVGWWPGDARYPHAAFFAFAFPPPDGYQTATLSPPAARWHPDLREVHPELGRRSSRTVLTPSGARLRPFGRPPRVRRLRLGPRPCRQRPRRPTTDRLIGAIVRVMRPDPRATDFEN